jgi:hypothetical protein
MKAMDNHSNIEQSNGLALLTVVLYIFASLSLKDWATILAMGAAITTIAVNIRNLSKKK